MSVDREQIREDALAFDASPRLGDHCLALLTELEQAESRLGRQEGTIKEWRGIVEHHVPRLEARLAKVPALVEALREFADNERWEVTPQYQSDGRYRFVTPSGSIYSSPWGFARGALAAWESE